jgi:hypothetical protein
MDVYGAKLEKKLLQRSLLRTYLRRDLFECSLPNVEQSCLDCFPCFVQLHTWRERKRSQAPIFVFGDANFQVGAAFHALQYFGVGLVSQQNEDRKHLRPVCDGGAEFGADLGGGRNL